MATKHARTGAPAGDPGFDEGWGPSVERRGRRRVRRWSVRLLVLVLLLLLAVPAVFLLQLSRTSVDGLASSGSPLHVLVAGSDSREGLTAEEQRELSTGSAAAIGGERTDTVFVMSVQGGDVALLSFPRDLWVTRCDGSVGRLNVAQSIDGPGCLVTTIRELSGIGVAHYLGIDFSGFVGLVDAVGGVELCLDEPIRDRDAGLDLPAGCQVLDGRDALGFVRVRKIDNDLERIRRQQRFVQALASEVLDPSLLLRPTQLWAVSSAMGDAVLANRGLGPVTLVRLAWGMRGLAGDDAQLHTVPVTPGRTSGGASVLYVENPAAEQLFARFRSGAILTDGDGGDAPAPADISVTVSNGTGVSGLAARVADGLTRQGYDVVGVGNAPTTGTTVIRHPPGAEAAAQRLAADLPLRPQLEPSPDVGGIDLVLGTDSADLR